MSAVVACGPLRVRPMHETDLDAVCAIEHGTNAFPWSRGIFKDCLRAGYTCSVLEREGVVDAFGIMQLRGTGSRVLNLCVRREVQGEGLGRTLLAWLIDAARGYGADTLILEVRPTNRAARGLYRSMGFNEIGTRAGYYPAARGREDALILARDLGVQGLRRRSAAPGRAPSPGPAHPRGRP